MTNPLSPSYFYPGGAENVNAMNDPYGEKTSSMGQANFRIATKFGAKALSSTASAAGLNSVKAGSSAKSELAASECGSRKQRPQTAVP